MHELLKIYVDRLREGASERISGSLPADFLDISDGSVAFKGPIEISGEAYIAEKTVVVRLKVQLTSMIPCIICGDMFPYPMKVQNTYITVPLEEVKGGIFNIQDRLREEILLEVPHFLECHGGNCPSRGEIEKYLISDDNPSQQDTYHPFKEL